MRARFFLTCATTLVVLFFVQGCDQLPGGNRYEVVVDKNGRTVRLDKKTGEIVIIEGDRLISPKDAIKVEQARKEEAEVLAAAKGFEARAIKHLFMTVALRTSWQDGNVYYDIRFTPLSAEPSGAKDEKAESSVKLRNANLPAYRETVNRHTFTLILEDSPFQLLRKQLDITGTADEKGDITGHTAKGNAPMSQEAYKRVDEWAINWRRK